MLPFKEFVKALVIIVFIFFINIFSIYGQAFGLWGTTSQGGSDDKGYIINLSPNLNGASIFSFPALDGAGPTGIFEVINGKIYGTTTEGGDNNFGVIYEYDLLNDDYKVMYSGSVISGTRPTGLTFNNTNGKFLCLAYFGGTNNHGAIFELDPVNQNYSLKSDFSSTGLYRPIGKPLQHSNGKWYGITLGSSSNESGFFSYSSSPNRIDSLAVFQGMLGNQATEYLIEASNGKVYGTTINGGQNGTGVLFEYSPTNDTLIAVKNLNIPISSNLIEINQNLVSIVNGNLIEYDFVNDSLRIITTSIPSGVTSSFNLLINGNIYFLSSNDRLYSYDIQNNSTLLLHDFRTQSFNGSIPRGHLSYDSTTNSIYGTCRFDGPYGSGLIYKYDLTMNRYSPLVSFGEAKFGSGESHQPLFIDDGYLYGVRRSGGKQNMGVLYQFDPISNSFTNKADLDSSIGRFPNGGLCLAANGKLYGVTERGGTSDLGALYEFDPASFEIRKVYSFDFINSGILPFGSLVSTNKAVYGILPSPNPVINGKIYSYNFIDTSFSIVHDFSSLNNGINPISELTLKSDSLLYGITANGGNLNKGILYEYNLLSDSFRILHHFSDWRPIETIGLTFINDSILVGYSYEGPSNNGKIFEFNTYSSTYSEKLTFDFPLGVRPRGKLLNYSNGILYGTLINFSIDNSKVFSFNRLTNSINNSIDLASNNGKNMSSLTYCKPAVLNSIIANNDSLICGDSLTVKVGMESSLNNAGEWALSYGSPNSTIILSNRTGAFKFVPAQTGTYHISSRGGCPFQQVSNSFSIVVQPKLIEDSLKGCKGESLLMPDGTSLINLTSDTTYISNLTSSLGCDTTIRTHISITSIDTSLTILVNQLESNDTISSHQWLRCDSNYARLVGETNPNFIPIKNGYYAVELTNNSCIDTSRCIPVIGIGIEENFFNNGFKVYPNPFLTNLNIEFDQFILKGEIEIYNSNWTLVHKRNLDHKKKIKMDLELKSGIYFIKLQTEKSKPIWEKLIRK